MNGEQKTAEWITQVGEDGAVIPREHLSKLADLIQRDEWQRGQNQSLYAEKQKLDGLRYTVAELDARGQKVGDRELQGVEAFQQLRAEKDMLDASGGRAWNALQDQNFVMNLALAFSTGDQAQVRAVMAPPDERSQVCGRAGEVCGRARVCDRQPATDAGDDDQLSRRRARTLRRT